MQENSTAAPAGNPADASPSDPRRRPRLSDPERSRRAVGRKGSLCSLVAGLLVAAATSASAQCDRPGNSVPNCDFEVDDSDWTLLVGTAMERSTSSSHTGAGSLYLRSALPTPEKVRIRADNPVCVPIRAGDPLLVQAFVRWADPPMRGALPTVQCLFQLYTFDNETCEGPHSGIAFAIALLAVDWVEATSTTVDPDVRSAIAGPMECNSSDPFQLFLDDVFLGLDPLVFADGFESGMTDAWDSEVP